MWAAGGFTDTLQAIQVVVVVLLQPRTSAGNEYLLLLQIAIVVGHRGSAIAAATHALPRPFQLHECARFLPLRASKRGRYLVATRYQEKTRSYGTGG